ncbi:MAG: exodeoxyribonuclease VII small subunit [Chloroflexi bacterium]|nr:exodeoxyribonuclease VII small subunit [Chloroflexota bacterium]MBI3733768.1 exodeoxyribonuclease VII small subunit [Chloroflexota bacterium]
MPKSKAPSFEESYKELDETVQKLEAGELTLEDAISLFEHGMQLAAQLEKQLEQAELRVRRLKPAALDAETFEQDFGAQDDEA